MAPLAHRKQRAALFEPENGKSLLMVGAGVVVGRRRADRIRCAGWADLVEGVCSGRGIPAKRPEFTGSGQLR